MHPAKIEGAQDFLDDHFNSQISDVHTMIHDLQEEVKTLRMQVGNIKEFLTLYEERLAKLEHATYRELYPIVFETNLHNNG